MKTYADIKAEIAKLEARAEKARKAEIAGALLEYCQFDTHAMVRLTQAF